jgi:hypothetical protein
MNSHPIAFYDDECSAMIVLVEIHKGLCCRVKCRFDNEMAYILDKNNKLLRVWRFVDIISEHINEKYNLSEITTLIITGFESKYEISLSEVNPAFQYCQKVKTQAQC